MSVETQTGAAAVTATATAANDRAASGVAAKAAAAGAAAPKWWGQSLTVWGTVITTLATVLPVVGPLIGIDISADMVREIGTQTLAVGQALAGLIGTGLALYGRARATQPLGLRTFVVRA